MVPVSSTIRARRSRAKRATGSARSARADPRAAWVVARPSERGAGSGTPSSTRYQRRRASWRVRSPTKSSRWSTRRRSSRSGPSSVAVGRSGSRRAARATASASIGSLLPGSRPLRRAPAMSLGGTRTTSSPARTRFGLEPAGEVAAVLERPAALRPGGRPAAQLEVSLCRRDDRLLGELAARLVDRHHGVAPLVQIRSQDDHVLCLLLVRGDDRGPVGGHT